MQDVGDFGFGRWRDERRRVSRDMGRVFDDRSQAIGIGGARRRVRRAARAPRLDAVAGHRAIVDGMKSLREVRGIDDTPMTKTYAGVIVLEAAILVLLWLFGRAFS